MSPRTRGQVNGERRGLKLMWIGLAAREALRTLNAVTAMARIRQVTGFVGSPGGTRTPDLVVNSHPLYQLSYRGRRDQGRDVAAGFKCTATDWVRPWGWAGKVAGRSKGVEFREE